MSFRNRRWFATLALVVIVAAVAVLASWLSIVHDNVNPDAYARIRVGMHVREVEALIGQSPGYLERTGWRPDQSIIDNADWEGEWPGDSGNYLMDGVVIYYRHDLPGRPKQEGRFWYGERFRIEVALDQDGHVTAKRCDRASGTMDWKRWFGAWLDRL
jgi:hypothetical protein